jgi:DNA-binding Lrp family transcriptional regulator
MKNVHQPIEFWTKTNHALLCLRAYHQKDMKTFIFHFICLGLDPKSGCIHSKNPKTPITIEIQRLTGWNRRAISNALNALDKEGIIKNGRYTLQLSPYYGNRLRYGLIEVTFGPPRLSPIDESFLEKLSVYKTQKHTEPYYGLKDENYMLKQEISDVKTVQNKILEGIQKILDKMDGNHSTEEIKTELRHLKLVQPPE